MRVASASVGAPSGAAEDGAAEDGAVEDGGAAACANARGVAAQTGDARKARTTFKAMHHALARCVARPKRAVGIRARVSDGASIAR